MFSLVIKEELDNLQVALLCSLVDWCPIALLFRLVDIDLLGNEQPDNVKVAPLRGDPERRQPLACTLVNTARVGANQHLDAADGSRLDRLVNRPPGLDWPRARPASPPSLGVVNVDRLARRVFLVVARPCRGWLPVAVVHFAQAGLRVGARGYRDWVLTAANPNTIWNQGVVFGLQCSAVPWRIQRLECC